MLLVAERQRMAAPAIGHAPDHSKHGVFNHGNSRSYIRRQHSCSRQPTCLRIVVYRSEREEQTKDCNPKTSGISW